MAYDEGLANRLREVVRGRRGLSERKMFGGLALMLHGHMVCGVMGEELMVRVGKDAYGEALQRKHARPMDFTGKPMKGMVYVAVAGVRTKKQLESWVNLGLAHAETLPPKSAKKGASKKR